MFHERENLDKTEKLNKAREKTIKGRFEPQIGKTEPVGKTYKYVGRRFIDLSCVCHQLTDGCIVCKKEISLAHYEDESVIGLASILHITYLHHNFTV